MMRSRILSSGYYLLAQLNITATSVLRLPASTRTPCHHYSTILGDYQKLEAASVLRSDPNQLAVVEKLQALQERLSGYEAEGASSSSSGMKLLNKLLGRTKTRPAKNKMKDFYMYGSVGSGKTMLMDMFYNSVKVVKKRRVHFNGFMLDIHKRIHRFKDHVPPRQRGKIQNYDPIGPVARDVAEESHLLCFDEFQVTDIADAMILKALFTSLFECGVVVVATSNRPPDDLYLNGLQRSNFLPFIGILKDHCEVTHLQTMDYRETVLASLKNVYMTPNDDASDRKLWSTFHNIAQRKGTSIGERHLEFLGRKLRVPLGTDSMAMFTFDELCNGPLSATDYIHLCQNFETLFVRDIPRMTIKRRSEARRFITMIDNLYNHRVKLICTAEAPPNQLFAAKPTTALDNQESRVLSDDLDIKQGTVNYAASIFTGEEEIFAFDRTVSRLIEMQGDEYLNSEWTIFSKDS